jgi:hypothetical protein
MTQRKQKPDLYGTNQVATILGIPDWRVKNFSEGEAYRLPPSVRAGSGRGSRRLYGWEDIFRIGLADQLVKLGFTPETVGRAVREIPESAFRPYQAFLVGRSEPTLARKETPVLVNADGKWGVRMASDAQHLWSQTIRQEGRGLSLFVINLAGLFDGIFSELKRYWTGLSREEYLGL